MHFTFKASYWTDRYIDRHAPWDLNHISRPLKEYIDQLKDKDIKILVPGAGPGHEVIYLHHLGFSEVYYMDFSEKAAEEFSINQSDFPEERILSEDFFNHHGQYELILEQTFFCAFEPSEAARRRYVNKMSELLKPAGKLAGVWWSFPLNPEQQDPPYGGSREEYERLFSEKFEIQKMEECYNSEPERMGKEYFCVFQKSME